MLLKVVNVRLCYVYGEERMVKEILRSDII